MERTEMNQWRKGIASWHCGKTLYISVPFTWLVADAEKMAREWKGKAIIGGPGLQKPTACEGFEPILFHNPCATFTTRGCVNRCDFCAVGRLEPEFQELTQWRIAPVICDNNFLAASKKHIRRVIDSLKVFPLVDFNQGLEARKFTPEVADWFGELKMIGRFAFDHRAEETVVHDAVKLFHERSGKDVRVYCLINHGETQDEAVDRLELVRSWGALPIPMRYQPLDATVKDLYLDPNWTGLELSKVQRYYSRLNFLGHFPFADYNAPPKEQQVMAL